MGIRGTFTREFEESAIALYQSSGGTAKEIAGELGFERSSLGRWIKEKAGEEARGLQAFPWRGNPRDGEPARLGKENADLREADEILKKAAACFAAAQTRQRRTGL